MNPLMLDIADIQKSYRVGPTEVKVLKGINLTVEKGELLAVIGPSGSGKSTLMHMLGLWPAGLEVDAAEVSPQMRPSQARREYPSLPADLSLISGSDAHWLDWAGNVMTIFELAGPPTVVELRCALQQQDGRRAYVP